MQFIVLQEIDLNRPSGDNISFDSPYADGGL